MLEYKEKIEFAANTFAIDPDLLENIFYYLCEYIELGKSEPIEVVKSTNEKEKIKGNIDTEDDEDGAINEDDIPVTEGS